MKLFTVDKPPLPLLVDEAPLRRSSAPIGYQIISDQKKAVYFLADSKPSMLDSNKLWSKMFYSTGPMHNKK